MSLLTSGLGLQFDGVEASATADASVSTTTNREQQYLQRHGPNADRSSLGEWTTEQWMGFWHPRQWLVDSHIHCSVCPFARLTVCVRAVPLKVLLLPVVVVLTEASASRWPRRRRTAVRDRT